MADEKKTEATNSLTGTPGGESPAVPANAATISETQQVSAK